MPLPVRDRAFTPAELEQLRLLLSTFRDGSGQRVKAGFMPNFLSFERVCASIVGGTTNENKGIFDVDVPGGIGRKPWGISCKMASTQPNKRCWFMELSNSAKYLHDAIARADIDDWKSFPDEAGPVLVNTVNSWHETARDYYDVDASKYLILTHDAKWNTFQIACFDLNVLVRVAPTDIRWVIEGRDKPSSLAGHIETCHGPHRLWQWYANSGGQLKFYPPNGWEEWSTPQFELLVPPIKSMKDRVDEYWPNAWPKDE